MPNHTHAITDLDIAGGTEIGGALADGDLIVLHDVSGTPANKTTTVSRIIDLMVSTGRTLAGAWAFSSTTRPTSAGTGMPASNSLITSQDGKVGALMADIVRVPCVGWVSTAVGTGVYADAYPAAFQISTGTTANSSILAQGASGSLLSLGTAGGFLSKSMIPWNLPVRVKFQLSLNSSGSNALIRFTLGEIWNNTTVGDPSVRSIGIKIDGYGVKLVAHNGTSYVESAVLTTISVQSREVFMLESDGAGNVQLYRNGVAVGSPLSGAPTTISGSPGANAINFSITNKTFATNQVLEVSGEVQILIN